MFLHERVIFIFIIFPLSTINRDRIPLRSKHPLTSPYSYSARKVQQEWTVPPGRSSYSETIEFIKVWGWKQKLEDSKFGESIKLSEKLWVGVVRMKLRPRKEKRCDRVRLKVKWNGLFNIMDWLPHQCSRRRRAGRHALSSAFRHFPLILPTRICYKIG